MGRHLFQRTQEIQEGGMTMKEFTEKKTERWNESYRTFYRRIALRMSGQYFRSCT